MRSRKKHIIHNVAEDIMNTCKHILLAMLLLLWSPALYAQVATEVLREVISPLEALPDA